MILDANPDRVVQEWGPHGLFAGGYRVSVPFAGALLQRVVGIDRYTFSTLFMIGIPILTGLALAAAFFRSRSDPLVIHMTMLATVAMFLATPYVGYLDNITVLFLLSLMIPFARRGANVVGRANGAVPDRHRGRVHAPDHLRDLRRHPAVGLRLALPDEPVLVREPHSSRRAAAVLGRASACSRAWPAG